MIPSTEEGRDRGEWPHNRRVESFTHFCSPAWLYRNTRNATAALVSFRSVARELRSLTCVRDDRSHSCAITTQSLEVGSLPKYGSLRKISVIDVVESERRCLSVFLSLATYRCNSRSAEPLGNQST